MAAMIRICIVASLLVRPLVATGKCAEDKALEKWHDAHGKGRVDHEMFLSMTASQLQMQPQDPNMLREYLSVLFDAGVGMMLPAKKTDLGFTCFSYSALLAKEMENADGSYADNLGLMAGAQVQPNKGLDDDFAAVPKDGEGRVTEASFVAYYSGKYAGNLKDNRDAYVTFLGKAFLAGRMMMLQDPDKFVKGTIGGHCFRYAGLLAGEFYFDPENGSADPLGILAAARDPPMSLVEESRTRRKAHNSEFMQALTIPRRGDSYTLKTEAARLWRLVHSDSGSGRVTRDMFLSAWPDSSGLFKAYLNTLFEAATAMMLPKVVMNLDKHCFSYAAILAEEFYDANGVTKDKLGLFAGIREEGCARVVNPVTKTGLNDDFGQISKNTEGRVTEMAFKNFYATKYAYHLDTPNGATTAAYKSYLEKVFHAVRNMALPVPATFVKGTLGANSFMYAGLMAGEFYFAGTAGDVLGIGAIESPAPLLKD